MNEENKSIHDFDFNLICEYFSGMERQGPGSVEMTLKALSFIDNLPPDTRIADIGCGTGTQTITLAQNTSGHITAMDLFPQFIDILNNNVKKLNLEDRFSTVVGDMCSPLPFCENELDLIWSEGAIYNIGFEKGMNEWKKYIKPGGYIAVSEGTWFTPTRPKEIEDFWMMNYPEIDTISNKVAVMENAGYLPMAAFILPESCWLEDFYVPHQKASKEFLEKYGDNKMAQELVAAQQHEERLYNKYKDYYGYVFYIGKKIG